MHDQRGAAGAVRGAPLNESKWPVGVLEAIANTHRW
jgi:hypothetical protein